MSTSWHLGGRVEDTRRISMLSHREGKGTKGESRRYTQDFDAVTQRRKKNKSSMKKLFLA